MNLNLDFLKNVELEVPKRKTITRSTANKIPEGGLLLRVFSTGKIYPSRELAARYGLEYTKKDSEVKANGLDIFKSSDWPMFPVNSDEKYVFIAPVSKKLPKVDLFAHVGYDEDGNPKNSVMEQGGGSFGVTLLEMLKEVYGVEVAKGEYIDLEVKDDIVIKSPNDVYYIPKTITRGEKKGQVTVVRRENITVMPLVPVLKNDSEASESANNEVENTSVSSELPTKENEVIDQDTESTDFTSDDVNPTPEPENSYDFQTNLDDMPIIPGL